MDMKKKEYYKDFIGEKILVEIDPYEYDSEDEALRDELWRRIKKDLTYSNGLLCSFKKVKTTINKKIIVFGIVTQCEVDCG